MVQTFNCRCSVVNGPVGFCVCSENPAERFGKGCGAVTRVKGTRGPSRLCGTWRGLAGLIWGNAPAVFGGSSLVLPLLPESLLGSGHTSQKYSFFLTYMVSVSWKTWHNAAAQGKQLNVKPVRDTWQSAKSCRQEQLEQQQHCEMHP